MKAGQVGVVADQQILHAHVLNGCDRADRALQAVLLGGRQARRPQRRWRRFEERHVEAGNVFEFLRERVIDGETYRLKRTALRVAPAMLTAVTADRASSVRRSGMAKRTDSCVTNMRTSGIVA